MAEPAQGASAPLRPAPGSGVIDLHAHLLSDTYRNACLAAGHDRPDGTPGLPTWSAEDAVSVMTTSESMPRCCLSPHPGSTSATSTRPSSCARQSTTSRAGRTGST